LIGKEKSQTRENGHRKIPKAICRISGDVEEQGTRCLKNKFSKENEMIPSGVANFVIGLIGRCRH
jgi:hypothetical protein